MLREKKNELLPKVATFSINVPLLHFFCQIRIPEKTFSYNLSLPSTAFLGEDALAQLFMAQQFQFQLAMGYQQHQQAAAAAAGLPSNADAASSSSSAPFASMTAVMAALRAQAATATANAAATTGAAMAAAALQHAAVGPDAPTSSANQEPSTGAAPETSNSGSGDGVVKGEGSGDSAVTFAQTLVPGSAREVKVQAVSVHWS